MPDYIGPDRRGAAHEDCGRRTDCRHASTAAEEAADEAVKKVFAILGVDIAKPSEVEEFRKDLRFGQSMRKGADKGLATMIAIVFGGIIYALWAGLQVKIGGK